MVKRSGIVQSIRLTCAARTARRATPAEEEARVSETVRETRQMTALMNPRLVAGEMVFCSTNDAGLAARAQASSLGWLREEEGITLILERRVAEALGFPVDLPMRRILLSVHSALDGVGLTAAVASALSAGGIPCNVVAAFHHDHVFVPTGKAERALAILEGLQANATREGG
jgi:hypothetical protein